jgi:hypothetical protein
MHVVTLAQYLAEGSPSTNQEPPWVLIILGAIAWFAFWSHRRDKEKDAEASARFEKLSDDEIHDKERKILSSLKREPRYINELASIVEESARTTLIIVRSLHEAGEVEIVEAAPKEEPPTVAQDGLTAATPAAPPLTTGSRLKITSLGLKYLRERPQEVKFMPSGDLNLATNGSTINSRSIVVNSQKKFCDKYDSDLVQALARFESIVRIHGKADDVEILEGFLNEAKADKPKGQVLKSLFSALQKSVPTLASAADIAVKMHTLWS